MRTGLVASLVAHAGLLAWAWTWAHGSGTESPKPPPRLALVLRAHEPPAVDRPPPPPVLPPAPAEPAEPEIPEEPAPAIPDLPPVVVAMPPTEAPPSVHRLRRPLPVRPRPRAPAPARSRLPARERGATRTPTPLPSACPRPPYPLGARRRGLQGDVAIRALVGPDGRVRETRVLESSGHPALDRAATRTIRTWRFRPGLRDGVPVARWVRVPVRFRLE